MIKSIEIIKKYKTIPDNFVLKLEQMTIITGENNSGKTNFIKALNDKKRAENVKFLDESKGELTPKIIYIAAENISPSESECKPSQKTSGLIENLSGLFSNIGVTFKLEKEDDIVKGIEDLIDKTNDNLKNFAGSVEHKLTIDYEDKLNSNIIIQALIKDIKGSEKGQERKLEDLGQGTQRIIVASILKAYIDILIEKEICTEEPILILFEEPEIYLHPKLKRSLNATLETIAGEPNHQVIITTHDSYFVFPNFDNANKRICSFKKDEDGVTNVLDSGIIDGIEDELLFIFLYSRLTKDEIKEIEIKEVTDRVYKNQDGMEREDCCDIDYIRHQIHHSGDNEYTFSCGVSKKEDVPSEMNFYTQEELSEAIIKMSEKLGT